jgi:hypothetical protein
MIDKAWHRSFDDPIPLPGGSELLTLLRDAANYMTKLPRREHDAPAWRAAIEALMLVAEHGGGTMLSRIGIMRALYPDEPAPTVVQETSEEISDRQIKAAPPRRTEIGAAPADHFNCPVPQLNSGHS